jgi:hypothetical protein
VDFSRVPRRKCAPPPRASPHSTPCRPNSAISRAYSPALPPRCAEVPVGVGSDMVVALANSGSKMFKVAKIEAKLLTPAGKLFTKLETVEYAHPLGPGEQRSFRYPIVVDAETTLGEYKLVTDVYYNDREKEPFVSLVCEETIELVPAPPTKEDRVRQLQYAVAGVLIALVAVAARSMGGGASSNSAKQAKKASGGNGGEAKSGDEWLTGTVRASRRHHAPARSLPRPMPLICADLGVHVHGSSLGRRTAPPRRRRRPKRAGGGRAERPTLSLRSACTAWRYQRAV